MPVVVLDLDNETVLFINSGWERDVQNHPLSSLNSLSEKNIRHLMDFSRCAKPGDKASLELVVESGSFSVEVTLLQQLQGEVRMALVAVEDAATGDRSTLEEKCARLEFSLNNSEIGLWDWNIDTGAVVFNSKWAEMLGYSLDELPSNVDTWEHLIHPLEKQRVNDVLQQHLDGITPVYDCEHRLKHRDGHWVWIHDKGRVVEWDKDGKPLRAIGTHTDITAQKHTEASLEQERDLFVSGPVIVFKWRNQDGWPVEYVSSNVKERLGFAGQDLLEQKVDFADLVHPDDLERVLAEVQVGGEGVQSGNSFFIHEPYRIRTCNGDYLHVFDQTTVIRDDSGDITHFHGYLIDISARVKAEKSLGFLKSVVDLSHDPVYVVSATPAMELVYANKAAKSILNIDAYGGVSLLDLNPEFAQENIAVLGRIIEREGQSSFETSAFASKCCRVAEVALSCVSNEGQQFLVGYVQNIDHRKSMEVQLKEREARLNAMFQNANVGIMLLEGGRFLRKGNQRLAEIFGYASPGDMAGMSMRKLHLDDDHFRRFGEQYYNQLAENDLFQVEYPLARRDGTEVWVSLSGKAIDEHHPADLDKGVIWIIDDITGRRRGDEELLRKEAQLRAVFDNLPYLAWMKDTTGVFQLVNRPMAESSGHTPEQLIGKTDFDIWPEELASEYVADDARVMAAGTKFFTEERVQTGGGDIWVETYKSPIFDQDGALLGSVGISHDVTQRIETEQALKRAEEQSRLLLEFSNEGIFGLDTEGVTTFVNPAAAQMLGYQTSDLIGKRNHELIHHSSEDGDPIPFEQCRMTMAAVTGQDYHVEDEVLWRQDGSFFPVEYWSTPIFREDALAGSVVIFHDISERKVAEQQIRELAYNDSLTGLPNRRMFHEALERERLDAEMDNHRFALLILDLDHFKEVNDTLGHPTGDKLLQHVAMRLQRATRSTDMVARLGGDEFVIIMSNISDEIEVSMFCERLVAEIARPIQIGSKEVLTGTSVGVYVYDGDTTTPDSMLSKADVALYRAKEQGRGNSVFYESSMTEKVRREAEIARQLALAIPRKELQLYMQPKYQLLDGKLCGYELLMRWHSSMLGEVSPADFIAVAERRGLIRELGLWAAVEACRLIQWFATSELPFAPLAINVSRIQLESAHHVAALLDTLRDSGFGLGVFEVEITETAYAAVKDDVMKLLEGAQQEGLRISIDDFGTGYSSLVSLRQLNASSLKVDCEFVRDMNTDPNDRLIVEATINMAHALNMKVVAEGVENRQQLMLLKQLGCDIVQGYYTGRPDSPAALSGLEPSLSLADAMTV